MKGWQSEDTVDVNINVTTRVPGLLNQEKLIRGRQEIQARLYWGCCCSSWGVRTSRLLCSLPGGGGGELVPFLCGGQETRWAGLLGQEDPREEETAALSSTFAWKISRGQGSLVGYSPWDHKVSDRTERLNMQACIESQVGGVV